MNRPILVIVSVAISGALLSFGSPAVAAQVHPASSATLSEALPAHPGAVQVDEYTVAWDNGQTELTVSPDAVGTCPTGDYCAFSGTNLSGSRISYSSCGTNTVSAFTMHSAANARSSGSVSVLNSAGTLLATIAAGGRLNSTPAGASKLQC